MGSVSPGGLRASGRDPDCIVSVANVVLECYLPETGFACARRAPEEDQSVPVDGPFVEFPSRERDFPVSDNKSWSRDTYPCGLWRSGAWTELADRTEVCAF